MSPRLPLSIHQTSLTPVSSGRYGWETTVVSAVSSRVVYVQFFHLSLLTRCTPLAHPVVRSVECEHGVPASDCCNQRARAEYAIQLCWPDEDAGTPPSATESWFDIVPTKSLRFGPLNTVCVFFVCVADDVELMAEKTEYNDY